MRSATDNPQITEDYLAKETAAGNILVPFNPLPFSDEHLNSIGVIDILKGELRLPAEKSYKGS
jgi:hypothetical protein